MAFGLSKPLLSTDRKYFFFEDSELESDGYSEFTDLFRVQETYTLGFDTDTRFPLIPSKLLTFNETEMETEE